MNNKVEVSICCITYNQEKYIREAIESFLMQKTNFGYEIVIHDDASTDNTVAILKEYQQKHPDKVVLILEKENQYSKNPNSVLEIVFKKARGKYIAVCEGDDGFTDEMKLQKQYDIMENGNYVMCSHNTDIMDESGELINRGKGRNKNIITIEDFLTNRGNMHTSSLFFRKKDVQQLPIFFKESLLGDLPLKLFLLNKGNCYMLNDYCFFYRKNAENSWSVKQKQDPEKKRKNVQSIIETYISFDKYSKHKYKELIDSLVIRIEFNYYTSIADLKKIKLPKYKKLYKKLNFVQKVKLRLKNVSWFYKLYTKIRYGK